jgi:hypothetical protein
MAAMNCQQMDPNTEEAVFRVDGEAAWSAYDPLIIVAATTGGQVIDTLFRGKLDSMSQLWSLQAPHYDGGEVLIAIYGYRNGQLIFSQGRNYDGATQRVLSIADTIPVLQGAVVATAPSTPVKTDTVAVTKPPVNPPATTPVDAIPPKIVSATVETTVSIRDVVPLSVHIDNGMKKMSFIGWDFESDGKIDDSLKSPTGTIFTAKPRFAEVGEYRCRFVVRAANGQTETTMEIHVVLDPPTAEAGEDTTVAPGGIVLLHALGEDGFGPIVKREWSFDGAPFRSVSQQETKYTAPLEVGDYEFVLRITDSDGLTALDTMTVTVDDAWMDPLEE